MKSTAEPLVRCFDIAKYFGGVVALGGVSLELLPGELTCLVGDNGAGKSTLVKILSGLHQPDEGEIWLGSERVDGLTAHRLVNWESKRCISISRCATIWGRPQT